MTIDARPVPLGDNVPEPPADYDDEQRVRFTKPGPRTEADEDRDALAAQREDDPPPGVPRDQYDQPIIVLPDGSDVRAYRRASKYGGIIEDEYGLAQWGKRSVLFGVSRAHHLYVAAQAVPAQTGRESVAKLQDLADRALIIAGADAGAITGTALHKLSERRDRGEDLSHLDPFTMAALDAYAALLAPFEVLATELFVVCDELGSAGTLDRILRLRFPIVWPDGEVWPAGKIVTEDTKTGKVSSAKYWGPGYTCQQWVYLTGVPYAPGVTVLTDPGKRSVGNVARVLDQPGSHGRLSWPDVGVPAAPTGMLILHVPATDPGAARWERVDPEVAHADALAAQQAWQRHRVSRGARFLALPASALTSPEGHTLAGTDDEIRADAEQLPYDVPIVQVGPSAIDGSDQFTDDLEAAPFDQARAEQARRTRARTTAALLARIRRAATLAAVDRLYDSWGASDVWTDELTGVCQCVYDALTPGPVCEDCNYDRHRCPLCGIGVPHGRVDCAACSLRKELTDADSTELLETLWIAHGPAGDGLWADEHSTAAQAAYDRLTPEIGPGGPPIPPDDVPEPEPQQPETDASPEYDAAADPAHPITAAATAAGVFDDTAEHPITRLAGMFDDTVNLANLRTAIDEALDEDTLTALYDVHKPVQDGGDGLWDDECTARAQARYDALHRDDDLTGNEDE